MGAPVIRGGIGVFYDDINLNIATFSQLQERVLTRFGLDGLQVIGNPELQRFEYSGTRLRTPRSINWNVEVDREWLKNLFVPRRISTTPSQPRVCAETPLSLKRARPFLGWTTPEARATASFKLRRDTDSASTDEFTAAYVSSSASGDLNDFNSYFGNFENPIIQANERTRLPWDAPNRFIFWGGVPRQIWNHLWRRS
jgi:hypothetical protein